MAGEQDDTRADDHIGAESLDWAAMGQLTVDLAVEGGRLAAGWRAEGFAVATKSSPTDLVTDIDRRVETWIAAQLRSRRPGDGLVGEESGAHGPAGVATGLRWLVDPIDGTVNFALGLAQYAVSVAVEVDGRVVAGCVSNPATGHVFTAVLGTGAYLAHDEGERLGPPRRLTGPRRITLDRAVIGTGFSYDAARRARQGELVAQLLPRIADIRRAGAASLDLCAVAAGWLDGHFEAGLNEWDYAAGLLIATEAGCLASGLRGRDADQQFCAVAGADLAPDLFGLLADLQADRVLD